jgi:hypothetical protein
MLACCICSPALVTNTTNHKWEVDIEESAFVIKCLAKAPPISCRGNAILVVRLRRAVLCRRQGIMLDYSSLVVQMQVIVQSCRGRSTEGLTRARRREP